MSVSNYESSRDMTMACNQLPDKQSDYKTGQCVDGAYAHFLLIETAGEDGNHYLVIKTGRWAVTYEGIDELSSMLKRVLETVAT